MEILKFGGTSVADADAISRVVAIVARRRGRRMVVVSALARVTDDLVRLAGEAPAGGDWRSGLDELRRRHGEAAAALAGADAALTESLSEGWRRLERDLHGVELLGGCPEPVWHRMVATGERQACRLVAAALRSVGVAAEAVDGEAVIVLDRAGAIDVAATRRRARHRLARSPAVAVVGGFVGRDPDGCPVTLGRGGSDLSATVLAAALGATRVEIWTDVDGVMSAPPRWVPEAETLARLSYDEAELLAAAGARVLDARTLGPLRGSTVVVEVRNTFAGDGPRSVILPGPRPGAALRAVAVAEGRCLVAVAGPGGDPAGGLVRVADEPSRCLVTVFGAGSDVLAPARVLAVVAAVGVEVSGLAVVHDPQGATLLSLPREAAPEVARALHGALYGGRDVPVPDRGRPAA